jgi:nucleotide-binding universal stress UspA family protein
VKALSPRPIAFLPLPTWVKATSSFRISWRRAAVLPANMLPIEAGALSYVEQEKIDHELRLMLLGMAGQIESQGVRCDVVAKHGFAADVIREQIRETGATRLIMGTHGRRKLAQMALGSVANELLRNINIPIFAVGPEARGSDHSFPKKILHPVSLLADAKKSVDLAIDLAQAYRAELTLLHVLEPDNAQSVYLERTLASAENALAALTADRMELAPPIRTRVVFGNRVEEILHEARITGADWIVLGVDGAFPFWPFRDSTAYKVLAAAHCPVLTLRHDPRAIKQADVEIENPAHASGTRSALAET